MSKKEDRLKYLKEVKRILKPGGIFFMEERLFERGFRILRSYYGKEGRFGGRDITVYAKKSSH